MRLWDSATGASIATLEGHSNIVTSLSFSPDGSRLASGSHDETVRLWDGATGAPIATLNGHSGPVRSLSFSPDDSRLASGSDDETVRLWDGATGAPIAILEGYVTSLSFSPDGSQLASVSWDKAVRLWDVGTGAPIGALEGDFKSVYSLSRLPLVSPLASMSVGIHRDGDTDGSFDTDTGRFSSSELLSMSLCEIEDPSRGYFIQGTIINNSPFPLLWLPADTGDISEKAFGRKAAAFGCENGQVIIFDLTQLNLETVTM